MAIRETGAQKIYYSIGEVARMFEVNTSLIRFWEKEFDIITPKKNKKGNRLFTQADVDNLKIIYYLVKEKGFTLQGAKIKLKENKEDTVNTVTVVNKLRDIRGLLTDLKEQL